MRQAITTRFIGPTNFRGSRVKATCEAGSIVCAWDHALDSAQNHTEAAYALIRKLGWTPGHFVGGGTRDGYVFVDTYAQDDTQVAHERALQRLENLHRKVAP